MRFKQNLLFKYLIILVMIVLISNLAYGEIEEFPTEIIVAVTNFTFEEKADCDGLVDHYGDETGLDLHIRNSIINGTPGFSKETLDFESYVKDVLFLEWDINWDEDESFLAGAMATKLAP